MIEDDGSLRLEAIHLAVKLCPPGDLRLALLYAKEIESYLRGEKDDKHVD